MAQREKLVADLLLTQSDWLLRRKLSVCLVDQHWHRRDLTVDVAFDDEIKSRARHSQLKTIPVPLSLIEKQPAQTLQYDLCDAGGVRLTLPTFDENLAFGVAVLRKLVRRCFEPQHVDSMYESLVGTLGAAGFREPTPEQILAALSEIRAISDLPGIWRSSHHADVFVWFSRSLLERALVTIDRPVDSNGEVLKLGFLATHTRDRGGVPAAERAGIQAFQFRLGLGAWSARSAHVELKAPPGLEILDAELMGYSEGTANAEGARPKVTLFRDSTSRPEPLTTESEAVISPRADTPRGDKAHLYVANPALAAAVDLSVKFRVDRSGFVSSAAWITAIIATELIFLATSVGSFHDQSDAAATLLLALPAVAASYIVQNNADSVTNRMLTTVRRAVLASSALALLACALLLVEDGEFPEHRGDSFAMAIAHWFSDRYLWVTLAIVASWIALLAFLARRLPAPDSKKLKRSHRVLRFVTRPLVSLFSWPRFAD